MKRIINLLITTILIFAFGCASESLPESYQGSMVTPHIMRGPMPTEAQLASLRPAHVLDLMNVYDPVDVVDVIRERKTVQSLGIDFKNIPMSNETMPAKEDLIQASDFLYLCEINGELCIVHCRYGHDRTGWVVAVTKIRFFYYTAQQAYDEAVAMGHNTYYDGFPFYWKRILLEIEKETKEGNK